MTFPPSARRLLLGFREDRELADAFASSLGGARSSCRIEHPVDDRGVLSAVGSLTELAAEIGGADGGDGLDPVIGLMSRRLRGDRPRSPGGVW